MLLEFAGYLSSLIMGMLLGMIGGGGSILTVPILVYLFGTNPMLSTAYSLFIVGFTSLAGSLSHFKKGNVNIEMALIFGAPSVATVFLVRRFLVPAIPDPIFSFESFTLFRDTFILSLFAALMVLAAWSMIRPTRIPAQKEEKKSLRYGLIVLDGAIVGALTGLVGAGGGFLIIPALIVFTGISMKEAVGTSLVIITFKSLIGFLGDLSATSGIDYTFLLTFTSFAIAGIIIGSNLSKSVDNKKLKPAFGWFVLIAGIGMLIKEWVLS